jgi:8-hydroxy-5-deazaflavin:NADPH oxidoreductase
MKIGILGAGNVGGTLGTRWAQGGHDVVFGSRHPESDEMRHLMGKAGPKARTATIREAAGASGVLLLSTPWPATRDVLSAAGDLGGKIVIDAINPLRADLSGLDLGTTTSASETVAQWAPGARVVKAFNTVGANIMADPDFHGAKPVMFYCGDDGEAKRTVAQLADELGFDAQDAGPLRQARVLEPFAMLWISLAFGGYGRDIAFAMLRR